MHRIDASILCMYYNLSVHFLILSLAVTLSVNGILHNVNVLCLIIPHYLLFRLCLFLMVKGHSLAEAMKMSQEFTKMMLGEDYEITEDMGDIEALQGVSQFPARIKCATLAWKALEKGTVEKEGNEE